jgi:preprotein translocase subunit SecB
MAEDQANGAPGAENGAAGMQQGEPRVQIAAQFVRDLSFESPNVENLITGPGDNPNLNVEINVNGKHIRDGLFESVIDFKAHATNDAGVIYDLEVVYGGMFKVENIPQDSLEPFLLVECPTILFPFLRRLVADLTREGGFPPLFIDPINFAGLYMQRKAQTPPQ